jgi:hypothetical protein
MDMRPESDRAGKLDGKMTDLMKLFGRGRNKMMYSCHVKAILYSTVHYSSSSNETGAYDKHFVTVTYHYIIYSITAR